MFSFLDFVREMTRLAMIIRILTAVVCGGIVGLEREVKHRPAGFRTHILICMGAAVTTMTSQYLYLVAGYYTDLARLGAQVIAGIGFIGAGTIIMTGQNHIRGLTTAAGLWCSAIIGLAAGAGFIEGAILGTAIIMLAELVLIRIEGLILAKTKSFRLFVEYKHSLDLGHILQTAKAAGGSMDNIEITHNQEDQSYVALVSFHSGLKPVERIVEAIAADEHVIRAEAIDK